MCVCERECVFFGKDDFFVVISTVCPVESEMK